MATLQPVTDYTLTDWPKTEAERVNDFPIKFTVPHPKVANQGDRLFIATRMETSGRNSGDIKEIQYILMAINTSSQIPETGDTMYTATAKRVEV